MKTLSAQKPTITTSDVLAAKTATAIDWAADQDGTTPTEMLDHLFDYVQDTHIRTDLTAKKRELYARGTKILQTHCLVSSTDANRIRRTDAPLIRTGRLGPDLYIFATLWPIGENP
ncbi:MAG TPA: hypothetical protein VMX14_13185 [Anaerolineae bacterium]|nr:hypothetical protein [Anaerolineae bacterium]